MTRLGIGQAAPRLEDLRLVTGGGRFTDDLAVAGQCHAAFVRAPHAHARIRSIDGDTARQMRGVQAVYTHADLAEAGLGPLPHLFDLKQSDGRPLIVPPRPALADDRVRHVGDPVACVVADTRSAARAAAEQVAVTYQPLPACTDLAGADQPEAPQVWPQAALNIGFDWELGDRNEVEEIVESATHAVSLDFLNNRVTAASLEPRSAIGDYDAETGRLTLHVGSQGVHILRHQLATHIFHQPEDTIRVVTPDVGGGFGMKLGLYPEYVLVLFAARDLGRTVQWTADRFESFRTDTHGRDHLSRAELALDESGRFLALKVDTLANLGAYLSTMGAFIPTQAGSRMLAGCYTLPAVHVRVRGVFTNTAPVDAYRGAGRPEAAYCLERLVDKAARVLGHDPVDLRRRNFIAAEAMPYRTATGLTYDSGDFAGTLERTLKRADAAGFADRRRAAEARNRLRGLGVAYYIEAAAGGAAEHADVAIDVNGQATVLIGTQSNGQGHATAYRQILSETIGLAPETVTIVQGDSDRITEGGGTAGSRSVPVGGAALAEAARRLVTAAEPAAAAWLGVDADRMRFADGAFRCNDTNRFIGLSDLAASLADAAGGTVFQASASWRPPAPTFPNGCHVCEVEIDPDTGVAEIVRYTVVDDCGTVLNPALLAGQIRGGIAQGIGQAMVEAILYDADSGQILTGDFSSYCLPRADQMPPIDVSFAGTPCRTNPLGIKGAGEAGAIGAPLAVINALVDALAPYGVTHVDMPATPETLWHLIQSGRR